MEPIGILALFALVAVKEAGIPLPPPTALIVVGSGILATRGQIDAPLAITAIATASVVGAIVEFLVVRHGARAPLLRLLDRIGLEEHHVERAVAYARRQGAVGVAVGRIVPGIRGVIVPAAALAHLGLTPFTVGFAVGNTLYVAAQFWLGMVAGEWALRTLPLDTPALTIAAIGLTVGLWLAWWLLVIRPRARSRTAPRP